MSALSTFPDFQYPPRIRQTVTALWALVLLLNLAEYLLAWLRAFYGWLTAPLQLPPIVLLAPSPNIWSMLLSAHIGLAFALVAVNALAFLAPRLVVGNKRLTMQTALGARAVPLAALRGIRSIELPRGRYLVWVDSTTGLPLQNWLASLLFGRWLGRGFLLTSDLAGFDNIVATMVAQLKLKYGAPNFAAHFSEEKPTWLLRMLIDPLPTLIRDVSAADVIPISPREAAWQMVSVAAALTLPQVVAAIIHVQIPWGALVVFAIALLELPLAVLYLAEAPAEMLRRLEFRDVLRLYPLTQLPRWLIAGALTLLVIVGAPLMVMILAVVPALVLGCYLVLKLTEDWFAARNPDALLGLLVTAVVQFILYALFIATLAR